MEPRTYHIVIAHHEAVLCTLLERLITQWYPTARVQLCRTGVAALRAYDCGEVDLLIVNAHLPLLDGLALIPILRARDPTLPIIALSGDPSVRDDALTAGATAFMSGPAIVYQLHALMILVLPL